MPVDVVTDKRKQANPQTLPGTAAPKTIFFPFGLPGFEHLHNFQLKALPKTEQFFVLQAVDEPAVALIVMDARGLGIYDRLEIPAFELHKVGIHNPTEMAILVVIKINRERQLLQANTKAPLIINLKEKKGIQAILDDEQLSTEFTLSQEN